MHNLKTSCDKWCEVNTKTEKSEQNDKGFGKGHLETGLFQWT